MQAERIIEVKKIGQMPTFDIEVDSKEHVFYCDGVVGRNSHAVAYGMVGYWTAYAKYHSPSNFFTAALKNSIGQADGMEDVKKLVGDCKNFNVTVYVPSIISQQPNFYTDGEDLYFGLLNIKGIGESVLEKIRDGVSKAQTELNKNISQFNWLEILCHVSPHINTRAMTAMIQVGVFDYLNITRTCMKYEYEQFQNINDREIEAMKKVLKCGSKIGLEELIEIIAVTKKEGGVIANARRLATVLEIRKCLLTPPYSLDDRPFKIVENESVLLGAPITYTVGDTIDNDAINCSCKDFSDGANMKDMVLGVEISDVRPCTIKRGKQTGQKMYYLEITDGSAIINCTVFPDCFNEYGTLLTKGNSVILMGYRDKKYDTLIVKKASQA